MGLGVPLFRWGSEAAGALPGGAALLGAPVSTESEKKLYFLATKKSTSYLGVGLPRMLREHDFSAL